MPEQIKDELDAIIKIFSASGLVSKVFLFGSLARGEETPDSDIDLCALTVRSERRPLEIAIELRKKLYGVQKHPLDLLTFEQTRFEKDAERATSFAHLIKNEGVVLYEQSGH
ncbi:MAG: nucleotidyltransferase domain-containing protein [Candidatus Margulisbacteria bacterium]|jgi:predicted nucleotidyltransferase|nr:nucleotidyltransferase domain-containing protein [Candidatus Margulisiibacteriota bacterium]